MYTEFRGEFHLRADTPDNALKALNWLLVDDREKYFDCPYKDDHDFWNLERYHQIGRNYESPCHWDGRTWPNNSIDTEGQSWNEIEKNPDGTWHVVASADCKNYDSQIEIFCKWVNQFAVNPVRHQVGVIRYEEYYSNGILWSDGEIEYPNEAYPNYRK